MSIDKKVEEKKMQKFVEVLKERENVILYQNKKEGEEYKLIDYLNLRPYYHNWCRSCDSGHG